MYDPSMRVLTVLELLQARERVTGKELAERLEVSPRTVQRYIARLQDLGVPVAATRGPGGAYRLRPGFRLPPMMFGLEEAFALSLGLDALGALGLGAIAPATEGAKAKLQRVMPAETQARVEGARSALSLDSPRALRTDVALLIELASAIHKRQRVRLRYVAMAGDETEREVEPYGVANHEGRWFLAGYCLLRGGMRMFRVDRMQAVEAMDARFEPPAGFDVRGFVRERLALAEAPWSVEIWLDLPPAEAEARLPRGFAELTAEGDGTRVRCSATLLSEIAVWLLQADCAIRILRPDELRDAFRAVSVRSLAIAESE